MARYDLQVDPKLWRNLTKANTAFSKVEYPSAAEVVDVLVRHRLAGLLTHWHDFIKSGDVTIKSVLLNWTNAEDGDFVVLLNGHEIHGVGMRVWGNGDWPARGGRLDEVLAIAKDVLASHGLLGVLESIGIQVVASSGTRPENDVIMFESIL